MLTARERDRVIDSNRKIERGIIGGEKRQNEKMERDEEKNMMASGYKSRNTSIMYIVLLQEHKYNVYRSLAGT